MQTIRLDGLHVLLTRPTTKIEQSEAYFKQLGAITYACPAFSIETKSVDQNELTASIETCDLIVVTSSHCVPTLKRLDDKFLKHQSFLGIGPATGRALLREGMAGEHLSSGAKSEELFQAIKKSKPSKVVLLKGVGGRDYLINHLIEAGIQVHAFDVYKRVPNMDMDLSIYERWSKQERAVMMVTSFESLEVFTKLLSLNPLCKPILVPSERVAALAKNLGATRVFIAESAQDPHMADLLYNLEYVAKLDIDGSH